VRRLLASRVSTADTGNSPVLAGLTPSPAASSAVSVCARRQMSSTSAATRRLKNVDNCVELADTDDVTRPLLVDDIKLRMDNSFENTRFFKNQKKLKRSC